MVFKHISMTAGCALPQERQEFVNCAAPIALLNEFPGGTGDAFQDSIALLQRQGSDWQWQ